MGRLVEVLTGISLAKIEADASLNSPSYIHLSVGGVGFIAFQLHKKAMNPLLYYRKLHLLPGKEEAEEVLSRTIKNRCFAHYQVRQATLTIGLMMVST